MHPNTGSQLSAVQVLASTHPAGWRVWQWRSQVGQPGGSHCSGNSTARLPQAGQGTRQPAGVPGAVQTGLAQLPAQAAKGGETAFEAGFGTALVLACPLAVTVPSTRRLPARSAVPAVSVMLPPGLPEPCADLALRVDVRSILRLRPALRATREPAPVPAPDASSREPLRVRSFPASAVIESPVPSTVAFTLMLLPVRVRSWPASMATSPTPTRSLASIEAFITTSRFAARLTDPPPLPA